MMKLKLITKYRCDMNHWMRQDGVIDVIGTRELDIPSIDEVKIRHCDVDKGVFSDTVSAYDAVFYDGMPYKLSYDLKTKEWSATREICSPRQQAHMVNFVQQAKEHLKTNGFDIQPN